VGAIGQEAQKSLCAAKTWVRGPRTATPTRTGVGAHGVTGGRAGGGLDPGQSILMSPMRMAFNTAWARSWESSFW
jgi:hypothetical protein